MGKVIYWELCKKLNFGYANKWCMHKSESILENEIHQILRVVEIQTDYQTPTRKPDLVLSNKNLPSSWYCSPSRPLSKNKQILGSCQRTEKSVKRDGDVDINCSWCPWNGLQRPEKETREIGDHWMNRDHPNHNTVKISKKYLEKSWRCVEIWCHSDFS